jgi:MFS family permease
MGQESLSSEPVEKGVLAKIRKETNFIRGNFLLLLIGWLLVDFTREMAYTYYPLYLKKLGGSATILGLITAAATITEALVKIPGGNLADNYQRKKLIIVMTIIASASYLIYAFAPSWHFIILGAVFTSFCWIYTPGFDSIVMESLPEENRGTGYSIINLITRVSTTPSPLIASYLFTLYGVVGTTRIGFIFVSLAFLVASLTRWRLEEDTSKPEITTKAVISSLSSAKSFTEGVGVWKDVPRVLLTMLSIELLFQIPNTMFNTVFVYYFVQDLGVKEVQLGTFGTVIGISVILLAIPSGKLIDKFGRIRPLLLAYAICFFLLPLLLFDIGFTLLLIATPLIALMNVIFYTATQALWADLIPENMRGRVSGSKGFFHLITVASSSMLGGFIYDNISHQLPIYLFIAASLVCFTLTLVYIKEPDRNSED